MKRKKTLFKRMISAICTAVMILTLLFYEEKGNTLVVKAAEGDIAWDQLATVFPDAAVCDAVKEKLIEKGVAEGSVVTQANLLSIGSVDIYKKNSEGVINLSGVERLTELSSIEINGDILSLAPLNNLISLKYLDITNANNDISFAQMSNVSSLTSISLAYSNGIKSLDGLEKNVNLYSLDTHGCDNLTDVSACSSFTELEYLSFYSCEYLVDITPVANLQKLVSVDIGLTSIKDISPLNGKTGIKSLRMQAALSLEENADATCQVLSTLTGVETLCIRESGINNITLEKLCNAMPQLQNLDLLRTGISDLKPVTKLTNIKLLDIGDNKISDFSPLKGMPNVYIGSCCNTLTKEQYVVFEGSDRTVKNPFVDMNGNVIVPEQSDEFTYNATDNTITYVGDDWEYALYFATIELDCDGRKIPMELYIRYKNIIDPITITTQPESVSVMEDDEIILSVVAESYDDNFKYQWYKGDDKLDGETNATLTIEEAKTEDAGSYKCVVTNATATATSDVAKVEVKKEEVTTQAPTTEAPTTETPTTQEPTTQEPTTSEPTTSEPTTQAPSTGSTTDVTPEDNTTAAPATTEAANTDTAVTTGDTANPMTAIIVLMLALIGMVFLGKAYRYKEQ